MPKTSKGAPFPKIFLVAFIIFGLYLAFSLFELWAFVPFWVKNLSLVASILGVYFYARKTLKKFPVKREPSFPRLGLAAGVVAILVAYGVFQAGPALPGRVIQALTLTLTQPPKEVLLSLEVVPPVHSGVEKTFLWSFEDGPVSRVSQEKIPVFPEGSIVNLKIQMEESLTPIFTFGNDWVRVTREGENLYSASRVLVEPIQIDIQAGPYVGFAQSLGVVPDENPEIAFSKPPVITARQSVQLFSDFRDDFGVEELYLEMKGSGVKPRFIRLPLLAGEKAEKSQEFFLNLLADEMAGTRVSAKLVAFDALGQKGESETLLFDLPEKTFLNVLAQEIIKIRKALLLNPNRHQAQVNNIENLTEDPSRFSGKRGAYLALRSTFWRLRSAETQKDIDEVNRLLWQTALTLEDDGSFEEQTLSAFLEEMAQKTLEGEDIRGFEQTAVRLRAKADDLFRKEFRQTARRFTFNTGVDGFEIPQVGAFRELTRDLEREATENNRQQVLKTLLDARALFEDLGSLKGKSRRPGT